MSDNYQQEQIIDLLKKELKFKEIFQKLLYQKIVAQASQERNVEVTPEEIQNEANRIRREKRLEKAAETFAWLADQMITAEDLEAGIRDRLLAKKLAEHLFAKEVEKFFAQNKIDFDQVSLYQIIVHDEKLAQEIFYQIEDLEISFYEAAHLYDTDKKRRSNCGYEGKLDRWNLKPNIAAVVFNAQVGEVIPPVKTDFGYHILMVEEFIPAELTPERYQEIIDKMFQQWLNSEVSYIIHSQTA